MDWKLGFVGAGVMAEVMIAGLLEEGILPLPILFAPIAEQNAQWNSTNAMGSRPHKATARWLHQWTYSYCP